MIQTKTITSALFFIYILISAVFTFIYPLDLDKHFGSAIAIAFILSIIVELTQKKCRRRKNTTDPLIFIGITSLILVYIIQYITYGILVNTEALTLIAITGTIYIANTIKTHIHPKAFLLLALVFLTLSIMTIQKGRGYVFETGAGGILSAFIFLLIFIASQESSKIPAKIIAAASLLLTIAISIRAPILSAAVYIISKLGKKNIIITVSALAATLLALYIANPESRIFALHTSGRLVHWEIIISKFNISKIIYGMGAHSSTNILLAMGLEESMAAPHNEYIRYIYDLGLLGAISLFCILGSLYNSCPSQKKILVLILALQMLTDNIFTYYFNYLLFFIMLCVIPVRTNGNEKLRTLD